MKPAPDTKDIQAPPPLLWYAAYTAPGREWFVREQLRELDGLQDVFIPALTKLEAAGKRKNRDTDIRPPLLFSRYLFVRSAKRPELLPELCSPLPDLLYLAGASPRRPSPVFDHEIAVLRELCSQERHPELGPMPENGRVARIVSGPLTGAEGIVTRSTSSGITLVFGMPILAGCYELTVAPELIISVGFAGTKKPRHRAGRRGRKAVPERPAA